MVKQNADKRLWFKLDVGYLDNPKIAELIDDDPRAIILHLTCIAYAKQHGTNGRVPMRLAMRRACVEQCSLDACINAGLIEYDGDTHLVVHDYLRHQTSAEADQTRSDKGRKAAEARWRDAPSNATGNAPSIAKPSAVGNAEKSREEKSKDSPSTDVDGDFEKFWKAYPRKVGKGQARKAWKTALKKTDAKTLIAAVEAFAVVAADSDPKFIAHASTWLNGERWDDVVDEPELPRTGPDGWW